MMRKLGRGVGHSFTADGTIIDMWHRDGPQSPKIYDIRSIWPPCQMCDGACLYTEAGWVCEECGALWPL